MNKSQLVNAVAEAANLKKKDAEAAVAAVFDSITDSLKKGDKVQLFGFGSFAVKNRKARNGRNPATGETIVVPATNVITFAPASVLKDEVNK